MKKDLAVVIGRFQPWTKAHQKLAEFAASKADNLLILVGSFSEFRTKKNPLLFDERRKIIDSNLKNIGIPYLIQPVPDTESDESWTELVKQQVGLAQQELYLGNNISTVLVGMDKDASSYYLKLFPEYDLIEYPKPENIISATDVREILYGKAGDLKALVTDETYKFLDLYYPIFQGLKE